MTAVPVKTLDYLGGAKKATRRLIVAGTHLKDGRVALIDRKNTVLLITNTDDESIQEVDLIKPLFEQNDASGESGNKPKGFYKEHLKSEDGSRTVGYASASWSEKANMKLPKPKYSQKEDVKPSDVNNGFNDDQLLITYTGKDFSLGVVYQLRFEKQEIILQQVLNVKVMDRTRSVVALDKEHLCATTQNQIVVLNKSGDCMAMHNRSKRDRGGLLMSDGNGR
ncbi:uncharacterized protein LOC123545595 [Mercenaria mercenaria]|uniref:uncharacterized protein LOC123545595 n=1 Tax=Mercenaria mercenaria TaxID=6596 RepID=UPI00234ED045|nr:uncharacterized protein LOC123545595 [Mercenaria mercenaria]